jgi:hypothetical protein
MDEAFVLEVEHNGKPLQFETRLMRLGYTYKLSVMVDEIEILFERDEEGGFRAIVPEGVDQKNRRSIDPALLKSIADAIETGLA